MIAEIESAIVTRLEALTTEMGIKVEGFPDNPDELDKPFPKGLILVGFKRENLQAPTTTTATGASVIQSRGVDFEIQLQLKNLRNHAGIYVLLDRIRHLLTGYQPSIDNNSFLYETTAGFVKLTNGVWYYSMTFTIDLVYIKKPWN